VPMKTKVWVSRRTVMEVVTSRLISV